MALQNQRVQAPQTGSRGAYEVTYVKSRSNLLAVAAFTLVNVILALVGSDSYFCSLHPFRILCRFSAALSLRNWDPRFI